MPSGLVTISDANVAAINATKRVLQAGGRGYVMKQEGTDVLLHAIRTVLKGEVYVSAAVNASLLRLLSSSIRAPRPSQPAPHKR